MDKPAQITRIIRDVYGSDQFLPLHAPVFHGNERDYVLSTIESTFVSSVGAYVDQFEAMLRDLTGSRAAIALSNGTSALFMALLLAGVESGNLVLTQSLTFVATANAIRHAGADPAFLDIDRSTLGLSPDALHEFLESECERVMMGCRHRASGRRVAACVPMHTFGFPCRIQEIVDICESWGIVVVEDAAEALGSSRGGRHCGTFGLMGTLSFNGNKICTTGGGGAILTNDETLGKKAKHLSTTAKIPHPWRFEHDMVGFNLRLPNLNAALGCGQLEQLRDFVLFKRDLAARYQKAFSSACIDFVVEPPDTRANYWLSAILTDSREERDACLDATNQAGVMTRPVWEPMHTLPMYLGCMTDSLTVTSDIADRLINIPSGVKGN